MDDETTNQKRGLLIIVRCSRMWGLASKPVVGFKQVDGARPLPDPKVSLAPSSPHAASRPQDSSSLCPFLANSANRKFEK